MHFLSDTGFVIGEELNDADGEAAQAGNILGAMTCPDSASVFIEIPIDHVVATILNRPVSAIQFEKTLWTRLIRRAAGHSQCQLSRDLPAFRVNDLTLNQEGLADIREVEVGIERGTAPDTPGLGPTMRCRRNGNEIRGLAILEEARERRLQRRLIAFNGEVVCAPRCTK